MKVFKFGGASVKDAASVRNVAELISTFKGEKLVVVISAMGKTTNALELILEQWFKHGDWKPEWEKLEHYHLDIVADLGIQQSARIVRLMDELKQHLKRSPGIEYDFEYDQLVCYGELLSTAICEAWMDQKGLKVEWVDVRHIICTGTKYREAAVDWVRSGTQCQILKDHLNEGDVDVVVTQGFIGSDAMGNTTTLGREGSDYSAAILAYLVDAESVTIWKDVPGMLNADPRWFNNTVKLDRISYREAIELSYYGASVIHPKTIQPLQNKGIPLYVKSFKEPMEPGTVIQASAEYDALVPSYIFKSGQWLVSISTLDFSFIAEEHLTEIFANLSACGMKINLMQNSAISFSFAVDGDERRMERLMTLLNTRYKIRYNTGLELLTVRHYDEAVVKQLSAGKEVLLEQRSRSTLRMLLR